MNKDYSEPEEIKKELEKKILGLLNIASKLEAIKKATGLSSDDLFESCKEYREASKETTELYDDVYFLMMDSKYFILSGIHRTIVSVLEIFEKNMERDNTEKNVEKCLDFKLVEIRDGMKERLKKVGRIYLSEHINPKIQSSIVKLYVVLFMATLMQVVCYAEQSQRVW